MKPNERDELIQCGLNQTYTLRPSNRWRCWVIQRLIRQGYMIPLSQAHNPEYQPRPFYILPENTTVTLAPCLTSMALLLSLRGERMSKKLARKIKPDRAVARFYSPDEVQAAQARAYDEGWIARKAYEQELLVPFWDRLTALILTVQEALLPAALLPGMRDVDSVRASFEQNALHIRLYALLTDATTAARKANSAPQMIDDLTALVVPVWKAAHDFITGKDPQGTGLIDLAGQEKRLIGALYESRRALVPGGRAPGMTEASRWLGARLMALKEQHPVSNFDSPGRRIRNELAERAARAEAGTVSEALMAAEQQVLDTLTPISPGKLGRYCRDTYYRYIGGPKTT